MSRALRERTISGVALAVLVAGTSALAQGGDHETPPVLKAADLVDASLLQGPHHRVDPEARNDGFMNHFTIRSDFGDFDAESEDLLAIRVQEVAALARMAEISSTEAFADALRASAGKSVTAVRNVASDPVGTVQGLPEGLSRTFRGMYYKGRKTGKKVAEEIKEELGDEEPAAAGAETPEAGAEPEKSTTEKTVETVKKYGGYHKAKRQLARSLQVDPYTTNPVVQAELDRLGRAAFAAGLTFKFAVPSVDAISIAGQISSIVYDTAPEELERRNDQALKEMGIDKASRFAFFDSPYFPLSLETRMVEALKRLSPAANRQGLVDLAATVETYLEARFFADAADLLAGFHVHHKPLRELVVAGNDDLGRVVAGVTADGTVVVAMRVDYLIWQAGMEGGGPLSQYEKRQVWTSGRVSPRAQKELAARGWTVRSEVSFGS